MCHKTKPNQTKHIWLHRHVVVSLGAVVNVLDGYIVLSEFELQSRYCTRFWTNILEEKYAPPPMVR